MSKGRNPDIILLIEEHEFYCHRIVLQCYSSFFDELNNLEAKNYLKLDKGITKEAFIAIYAWMLTIGQGGFHYLNRENILEVLIACQYLKVTDLEEQCLAFIDNEQGFSEENAFHLFMDASKLKHKAIMELMVPRVKSFFLHLVSSKEFLELDVEDLSTFLSSNYVIIHCEMEMFMSAVRWLMHNWEERRQHLSTVMRCIRFGLMSPSQLVDIRKNPESPEFLKITEDKSVQKMIDDGMAYSVENSLTGDKADHLHRCNLLKLDVPEPRNLSKETKNYKTYNDFLKFLQELHKNPRYIYLENGSEPKTQNSEDSLLRSQSQDSLYSANEHENEYVDKNLSNQNKSLPLFGLNSAEKINFQKEAVQKKFEEFYGQKLFFEQIDNFGNKMYKPIAYRQGKDTYKTTAFNERENMNSFNDLVAEDKNKIRFTRDSGLQTYYGDEKVKNYSVENFIRKASKGKQHQQNKPKMSLRENAAIIIQSAFRGIKVRKALRQKQKKTLLEESMKKKMYDLNREPHFLNISNCYTKEVKAAALNKYTATSRSLLKKSRSSDSSLAPINKTNYDVPGSLYFPEQPSILIFGGKSPGCKLNSLNNSSNIYRYVPGTINKWEVIGYLPKPRYHHSTTMLKGKIYLIGGSDPFQNDGTEGNIYDENWSFDPIKKQWNTMEEKLITPRKSFGLVTFHGCIYAIGGQSKDESILSSVEKYDLYKKRWEEVTPLPEPLMYPSVCVYKNNIWVAGGLSGYPKLEVTSHVYCYDPFRNLWSKSAPLRFGRGFSTLINYQDSLHIVGGAIVKSDELISTDSIDFWDERQGKWKIKANMTTPRHGHVVAMLGSQMLMIGGSTTKYMKTPNKVDAWCVNTGSWSSNISPLPMAVVGHSVITLPPSTLYLNQRNS